MSTDTLNSLGNGSFVLAVLAGMGTSVASTISFLNDNAPAFGIILTFIFGVVGVIFQSVNKNNADKNKAEIDKLKADNDKLAIKLSKIGRRESDKR